MNNKIAKSAEALKTQNYQQKTVTMLMKLITTKQNKIADPEIVNLGSATTSTKYVICDSTYCSEKGGFAKE